jgi:hypothetical protein
VLRDVEPVDGTAGRPDRGARGTQQVDPGRAVGLHHDVVPSDPHRGRTDRRRLAVARHGGGRIRLVQLPQVLEDEGRPGVLIGREDVLGPIDAGQDQG